MNIREIVGMAPVIPVLTVTDLQHAVPLAQAPWWPEGCAYWKSRLRTPVALAAIEAMRKAVPDAIVGVGTLTRAVDFAAAGRVGAQFGVTPGLTPELAAASRGARFPLLPGVMTPTELITARAAGFNVLKLFPAQQAGGVAHAAGARRAVSRCLFCPTGGITRASAADYLALPNVVCVGGSWVAPKAMLAAGDWSGIEALASDAASLRRS